MLHLLLKLTIVFHLWYFSDLSPTFWYNRVGNKVGKKGGNNYVLRKYSLNSTRERLLSEMRHNPNITMAELTMLIGISDTAIDNNIRCLKENQYLERIGSNKNGYWKVLEK